MYLFTVIRVVFQHFSCCCVPSIRYIHSILVTRIRLNNNPYFVEMKQNSLQDMMRIRKRTSEFEAIGPIACDRTSITLLIKLTSNITNKNRIVCRNRIHGFQNENYRLFVLFFFSSFRAVYDQSPSPCGENIQCRIQHIDPNRIHSPYHTGGIILCICNAFIPYWIR